jgi:acetolactate synthase-1/2/3 large subunit
VRRALPAGTPSFRDMTILVRRVWSAFDAKAPGAVGGFQESSQHS